MLKMFSFDATNNTVSINGSEIASVDTFGNYTFNQYSNDNVTLDSGVTTDYFHIKLSRTGVGAWHSVQLQINSTDTIEIAETTGDILFFDSDNFDHVEIGVRRMQTSDNPFALVTVSGYNGNGYNFRRVSQIIQMGAVERIYVSAYTDSSSALSVDKQILYSIPGNSSISTQTLLSTFESEEFEVPQGEQ